MRCNPYTSKAQHRLFRAMERRGQLPRGTASRWYHETPHYASLPEYVGCFGADAPATTPEEPKKTFWQRYGGDIIVGTITAVTGAVAVYFAMRYVGKKK